jgi:hypothetical protein
MTRPPIPGASFIVAPWLFPTRIVAWAVAIIEAACDAFVDALDVEGDGDE